MSQSFIFLLLFTCIIPRGITLRIVVSTTSGKDLASCLSGTWPCKTLRFVFNGSFSLSKKEIVLQGYHQLEQTLTLSFVEDLIIRGDENTKAAIHCKIPVNYNDTGSGIMFISVSNITIENLLFKGCGTLQKSTTLRNGKHVKFRSAVYLINSTDINVRGCTFYKNVGRGLSLYDVTGLIHVAKSDFIENSVSSSERKMYFGGGGIYIEFSYCSPGYPDCDRKSNSHNSNSRYLIRDCLFEDNVATSDEISDQIHIVQFRVLAGSDSNNFGEGAGIHVTLKGTSSNNTIEVRNCTFRNNSATYGGGFGSIFQDITYNITVHIRNCKFYSNSAAERGGGALQLGFVNKERESRNRIIVEDTGFIGNSAGWGGAVAFFVSRSSFDVRNELSFYNCIFIGNSASIGAAMLLKPEARDSIFDGVVPTPLLHNCSYENNTVVYTAALLNIANDDKSQHVLQSGVIDIESIAINISHYICLSGSAGSAIVAKSAQLNVLENTRVELIDNTAVYGGGMALLGFSVVELHPGSQVLFDSNKATEFGGAVYATSPHQTEFIFSHRCFLSYIFVPNPNEWNTSVTFVNNEAKYGYDVYTDSLLPCAKHVGNVSTAVRQALRWTPLNFTSGIQPYTIATSPAAISFTLPEELAPGQKVHINPVAVDDLGQEVPTGYQVFLDSDSSATTNNYLSDDGFLEIKGKPGTEFNLTLQTQNTRLVSVLQHGKLGECPLGFSFDSEICICSTTKPQTSFVGIVECDLSSFSAFVQLGYWAGCLDGGKRATSYCPPDYCDYHNASDSLKIASPRFCTETESELLCSQHRKGPLCGECVDSYSVMFHSEDFDCDECQYGAVGLLFYVLAEMIPLVVLFSIIMILKFKLTSGLMQSMLLFAQTISFITRTLSLVAHSAASLYSIHSFLVGFLSLRFFYIDALSFCLWKGATVLHNLTFNYVTSLASIVLLAIYISVVNGSCVRVVKIQTCLARITKFAQRNKLFNNCVVHGISTFLILSFTQYTVTSFQILSRISVYGEGGQEIRSVVRLQGSVEYFGPDHLPYAIPAVLVLIFFSLPPPLLLISYPLLWKLKAKLRKTSKIGDDTTIWPIRKLLPLIDSFQGVFRDNCRMFAGLLFLWRVILAAIFAFSKNQTEFFLLTQIALLVFLTTHVIARPYKQRIYNIIDPLMLVTMTIINSLSWFVFTISTDAKETNVVKGVISLSLIFMYLPIATATGYVVYIVLKKTGILKNKVKFLGQTEKNKDGDILSKFGKKRGKNDKTACNDEDLFNRAAEEKHSVFQMSEGTKRDDSNQIVTVSEVITDDTSDNM